MAPDTTELGCPGTAGAVPLRVRPEPRISEPLLHWKSRSRKNTQAKGACRALLTCVAVRKTAAVTAMALSNSGFVSRSAVENDR